MFKKWTACLLAAMLLILFSVGAFAAPASGSDIIIPKTLSSYGRSISSWYATESSRTELVNSAIADIKTSNDQRFPTTAAEAVQNNQVYVAYCDSNSVFIVFWGDTYLMLALYSQAVNAIIATLDPLPDGSPAALMERLRTGGSVSSYYQVHFTSLVDRLRF